MSAGAQPEIFHGRGAGGGVKLGHFNKNFVKNTRKKGLKGKHFGVFFSQMLLKLYFELNDGHNQGLSKINTLFSILKNGRRRLPSPS